MTNSERFEALVEGLEILRNHLLPEKFSAVGPYPDEVYTRTLAYRVLAHAEIESYLEDRVLEVSRATAVGYKRELKVVKTLVCLLAFSGKNMKEPPPTLTPEQPTQRAEWEKRLRLSLKIEEAVNAFDSVVRNNNGIKEKNVLGMLLPIGVEAEDIDDLWLSTMNSLGESRGDAAHSSAYSQRTQQPPDPETEYKTVTGVVDGLRTIDDAIGKLLD